LEKPATSTLFEQAAQQVQRRVGLINFSHWLRQSHWIAGGIALVVVLAGRRFQEWRSGEIWTVVVLIALWLLIGGVIALLRRPAVMDALLTLDRRGGWKDQFSSAWEFLNQDQKSTGEELHLTKTLGRVNEAITHLPASLPVPSLRYAWILPVLAVVFALSPLGRIAPDAGDLVLTDEMKTAAEEQAAGLQKSADQIAGMEALSEEEKEELERLRVEVEDVADTLANADDLTAGEMLDALEARARAAERLAEKMGLSDEAWASAEMLEEMAVHPDTADLSLSIKDKAAEAAAAEAEKLQVILEQSEITRETVDRLTDALDQIMAAAIEEDLDRPVGERVGNASTKMLDQQPITAAREFEELAKHFRFLGSREEAKEKLENLANSLRDAGSEISGSELQQMEKIASESRSGEGTPDGLQSINEGAMPEDLQKMLAPQMAQSGAGQPQQNQKQGQTAGGNEDGQANTPIPGEPQQGPEGAPQSGDSQAMQAPVPGQTQEPGDGSGQGLSQSDQSQQGEGEGGMLSAPIPGQEPEESGQGGEIAMAGGSGNQTGQGGNQAGTGTAEMIDSESEALTAAKDSEVVAQINDDGDSTVRAVEGQARPENANRSRQEIMADFIAAEEQALDGQALPLSRREHVIRYFSEIRRQFEEPETSP